MTQLTVNKALTTHFTRDNDGLLTAARVQGNTYSITRDAESGFVTSTTLANVDSFLDYNKYGETKSLQVDAPELSYAQDISRDALGRITELTETVDGFETNYSFVYDKLGQLTEYEKNGEVHSYSYDVNGNRLAYTGPDGVAVQAVYDEQDRIETWGEWTFSHTEHGDLYQRSSDDTALTLHYDELGNLLQADAAVGESAVTVDYKVDAMGRRVVRDSSSGDFREWVYQDTLRPVGEVANGIFTQFVYANDGVGGAPDFMVRSATADVYQLVKDHVGSVRFVVDANSGEVVQELQYDPFGRVLFDSNPGFQPFGFAGGLYDWETKLVRFGARDYDPGIGRWVAKDPIGFAGAQTNVYVYAGSDPVNFVDPTGLFLSTAWDVAVQAARGAWTSPQLAVGLLVGVLGSGFDAAVVNGNLEFYDNGITSGLSAATTFGQVIVYSYSQSRIAPSLRAHEQQHVPQSDVLGPAYLPAHIFNQGFFEYGLGFDHHDTPLERGPSNQSNPNPWGI